MYQDLALYKRDQKVKRCDSRYSYMADKRQTDWLTVGSDNQVIIHYDYLQTKSERDWLID